MTRSLILVLALALPALVLAQFRSIPADAKRGEIRHVGEMDVEINGKKMRLAPGAQIRDAGNLLVLPTGLPAAGARVKFELDKQDMVYRVWILSPQEAAQPDLKR